jgi:hypothetical protein
MHSADEDAQTAAPNNAGERAVLFPVNRRLLGAARSVRCPLPMASSLQATRRRRRRQYRGGPVLD